MFILLEYLQEVLILKVVVDNKFQVKGVKNVYTPGVLARGFNPERKTIIKAILENSHKTGQSIAKTLYNI